MFFSRSTLLRALVASAASIPFVAAQTAETPLTTDQMYGTLVSTAAPAPGFNVQGGSVFQNYVDAVNDKQFFQSTLNLMFMNILIMNILRILLVTLDFFGAVISPSLT